MKPLVLVVGVTAFVASALAAVGHDRPGAERGRTHRLAADRPAFVLPGLLTMTWGCDRKGHFASRVRAARRTPTTLTVLLYVPGSRVRHVDLHAGQSYTTAPQLAGEQTWRITATASPATRRVLVTMRFEMKPQSATCNLEDLRVAQVTQSHES